MTSLADDFFLAWAACPDDVSKAVETACDLVQSGPSAKGERDTLRTFRFLNQIPALAVGAADRGEITQAQAAAAAQVCRDIYAAAQAAGVV